MTLSLDEITDSLRSAGLDSEDRGRWRVFSGDPGQRGPRRLCVSINRKPPSWLDVGNGCPEDEPRIHRYDSPQNGIWARLELQKVPDDELQLLLDRLSVWALAVVSPKTVPAIPNRSDEEEIFDSGSLPALDVPLDVIEAFIGQRLGYGNLQGRAWFLGMEEACDEDPEELVWRFKGNAVDDLEETLRALGCDALLAESPNLQATWAPLIRAWLVASGEEAPTTESVGAYQRNSWGRRHGDHLLVELQPLPSPSRSRWPWTSLVGLRKSYWERFRADRVRLLGDRWRTGAVRIAVAYGKGCWPDYRQVFGLTGSGAPILEAEPGWGELYEVEGRIVALVRHPVSYGTRHDHWERLGRVLRPYVGRG